MQSTPDKIQTEVEVVREKDMPIEDFGLQVARDVIRAAAAVCPEVDPLAQVDTTEAQELVEWRRDEVDFDTGKIPTWPLTTEIERRYPYGAILHSIHGGIQELFVEMEHAHPKYPVRSAVLETRNYMRGAGIGLVLTIVVPYTYDDHAQRKHILMGPRKDQAFTALGVMPLDLPGSTPMLVEWKPEGLEVIHTISPQLPLTFMKHANGEAPPARLEEFMHRDPTPDFPDRYIAAASEKAGTVFVVEMPVVDVDLLKNPNRPCKDMRLLHEHPDRLVTPALQPRLGVFLQKWFREGRGGQEGSLGEVSDK